MKVMLVNGSPHRTGCTNRALSEVAAALEEQGVASDVFWIGVKPVAGCIACGRCGSAGRCVFDDCVNEFLRVAADYDGFVFGTPVYYAGMAGQMHSFMDRAFYASGPEVFRLKPAAGVVSARRSGTTAAWDGFNKYFGISQMITVGSQYWNMVHGRNAEEVEQDVEGLQTMRVLGRNMAWLLKSLEAGRSAGVALPQAEPHMYTNFVR
jgi:multimeric flavodoxin WrbA